MVLYLWFIILATIIVWYLAGQRKPKGFPPGPRGFPILGHLPLLGMEPYKTAARWKDKYGPVIGIDFGSFPCVIISDYKLIKEAMHLNAFAGRPKLPIALVRSDGKAEGILFTEGRKWQEQRRFTLRHLRDFGFGSKSMESIIQEEIREFNERLKSEVGIPISTSSRFNIAVVNALWTITSGQRFEQDDPKLTEVVKALTENIFDLNHFTMLSMFIPWVAKYLPEFISGASKLNAVFNPARTFIQPYIDSYFKTHIVEHPRNFLDVYIDEMKKTKDPLSSFHIDGDGQKSLLFTVLDLFLAGAETTSTTLAFMCLYMARYPRVQQKLAKEIYKVVGKSRLPSLDDQPEMPFTNAVINEVMRIATLIPLANIHSVTEDVEFYGYRFPKDTMVMINLYEVHNNSEIWGDPENFRPERFLSADQSAFERHEGFMSFSTGKRICPGESLARYELFLFAASIFQTFCVSIDATSGTPSLEPVPGGVIQPQPHKLIFTLRI